MVKLNMKEMPINMGKDRLIKIAEGLLEFFEKTDEDIIIVDGLRGYLNLWCPQDNSNTISFLKEHKVIKMIPEKKFTDVLRNRRRDAIVYKKSLLKLRKFLEKSDEFIQVGKRIVWGKGKYVRRSRVR